MFAPAVSNAISLASGTNANCGVRVEVGVVAAVFVGVGVTVRVTVAIVVGVTVTVGAAVGVGVRVGVSVTVGVGVTVTVGVGVNVGVNVGVAVTHTTTPLVVDPRKHAVGWIARLPWTSTLSAKVLSPENDCTPSVTHPLSETEASIHAMSICPPGPGSATLIPSTPNPKSICREFGNDVDSSSAVMNERSCNVCIGVGVRV